MNSGFKYGWLIKHSKFCKVQSMLGKRPEPSSPHHDNLSAEEKERHAVLHRLEEVYQNLVAEVIHMNIHIGQGKGHPTIEECLSSLKTISANSGLDTTNKDLTWFGIVQLARTLFRSHNEQHKRLAGSLLRAALEQHSKPAVIAVGQVSKFRTLYSTPLLIRSTTRL